MGLPRLEKCCCCFDLKSGNIVLGCVNAVLSFIFFVTMVVISTEVGTLEKDSAKEMELFENMDTIEEDARLSGLYAMSIILVLMYLTKFLFDLVLIYGIYMEKAIVIKVYFIVWTIFFVLSMFTFFLNSFYYGFGTVAFNVFYIGLNIYLALVSHSFYVQLNMREIV